jgi:hypothetical protein
MRELSGLSSLRAASSIQTPNSQAPLTCSRDERQVLCSMHERRSHKALKSVNER